MELIEITLEMEDGIREIDIADFEIPVDLETGEREIAIND